MELQGKSFFLRLLPYRAKGASDGVVLTLIDVSGLKAAEDALFHERYLLNSLLHGIPDAIYFKDASRPVHPLQPCDGCAARARATLSKPSARPPSTCRITDTALALHREDEAVLRSGQPQHYRLERRTTAERL